MSIVCPHCDSGVHAVYRGELPDGVAEVTEDLDDKPFGANDEKPVLEIYDHKHVCVSTGDHLPDTPTDVREWGDDGLRDVLTELDVLGNEPAPDGESVSQFDADDYEPDATDADETATDVRDLFAAIDRLDAQRVAERTIVREWLESRHATNRAFAPTWAAANYSGTAVFANSEIFKHSETRGGYGGPVCMAAIDAGLVSDTDCPGAVEGETWWKAIDHLRSLGFAIPEYESPDRESFPDVTFDAAVVHRAAGDLVPDDMDGQLTYSGEPLARDGEWWRDPHTHDVIDAPLAAAIDAGVVEPRTERLDSAAWTRAYQHLCRVCEPDLPRYLTREQVAERWSTVLGGVAALTFDHFDRDALQSEVTAVGDDVSGDPTPALDPAYRESESGRSVVVYPDGTIYDAHPDHADVVDPLRLVALDAGVITWANYVDASRGSLLQGETFQHGHWLPLLQHNLADISRTRRLAVLCEQYVPESDFAMKSLTPP